MSISIESAWTSTWCQTGPPVSISIFNSSTTSAVPPEWKAAGIKKNGNCGILLHIPLSTGCCESSILPSTSAMSGINSFLTSTLASSQDSLLGIPTAANGATYCHLVASNSDSLFSLNELYLRANGLCTSNHFRCSKNGTLQIYPVEGCSGIPDAWNLNLTETDSSVLSQSGESSKTTSALIGSVKANYVVIQDAESSIIWTTFFPAFLNAPDPTHYSYYLALIFYSLAVIGTIKIGLLYSYRFYKGRTVFMLGYMLSQFFWLIWICLDAYLLFSVISDFDVSHMLNTARDCLLGICTLLSVFITANILLIITKRYSVKNQVITMLSLVALQMALSGSLYLSPILAKSDLNLLWRKMIPAWVFFFYFFDLSPPIYVFFKSYQLYPRNRRNDQSYSLFKKYARFVGILLLLQFLNAFWYLAMFYIANFTVILGNDKYLLALDGAFAFSYVFHSLVTCILNHHMRAMLTLATKIQNQEVVYPSRHSTSSSLTTVPKADRYKDSYYEDEYEEETNFYDDVLSRKISFASSVSVPEPVHSVKTNYLDMQHSSYMDSSDTSAATSSWIHRTATAVNIPLYDNDRESLQSHRNYQQQQPPRSRAHYRYGFQPPRPIVTGAGLAKFQMSSLSNESDSPRLKHVSLVPLPQAASEVHAGSPVSESTYSQLYNSTQRANSPY